MSLTADEGALLAGVVALAEATADALGAELASGTIDPATAQRISQRIAREAHRRLADADVVFAWEYRT